jgi:hypothetical protein
MKYRQDLTFRRNISPPSSGSKSNSSKKAAEASRKLSTDYCVLLLVWREPDKFLSIWTSQ